MIRLDELPPSRCADAIFLRGVIEGCGHYLFYLSSDKGRVWDAAHDLERAGIVFFEDAGPKCIKVQLVRGKTDIRPGSGNDGVCEVPF